MFAALDVLFTFFKILVSCLVNPKKLPQRSWRGEFIFRLAKSFLSRSIGKDFKWIRARQNLLTLYSPDLLKVKSERIDIAGVSCITLQAKNNPSSNKVIVYFHGGGYAVGSAAGYKLTGAKLALACQAKVVLVDYRLAPDFALPAAQEDCFTVTQSLISQEPNRKIILMGDSAGGTLCLSTMKRLKDASTDQQDIPTKIAACVLISPWVAPLSYKNLSLENESSDMLDRHITQYWVDTVYLSEALKYDIDYSNLETLDLSKENWPKIYIQAAGAEVFLSQVQKFSTQLTTLGVEHCFDVFSDQFHVFQTFAPLVPEAQKALNDIAQFVRSL